MSVTCKIEPTFVGDKAYYTVTQMALLTNRTEQTIYALVQRGNSIRKMECIKIAGRTLIPVTELTAFPFTFSGPNAKNNVYHYDAKGNMKIKEGADKK
jgi:hypothetical protein